METNCLIKTLKSSIENSNLSRFNSISLSIFTRDGVTPDSSIQRLNISFPGGPFKIIIDGDGYFTDSTLQQNLGKTFVGNSGNSTIYFSPGNYKAYILGVKYGKNIVINTEQSTKQNSCILLDNISDLQYENRMRIQMRSAKGDVSSLKNIGHFYGGVAVDFGEVNPGDVYGDFTVLGNVEYSHPIDSFGNHIVLAGLPAVTGEVVNFVDTYIKKGNTYDINLVLRNSGITYDNNPVSDNLLIQNISSTSFEVKHTTGSHITDVWSKQGDIWVKN